MVCSCLGVKGVKRFDARHLVVNALIDKQLFRGTKSHAMTLPVCRYKTLILSRKRSRYFIKLITF